MDLLSYVRIYEELKTCKFKLQLERKGPFALNTAAYHAGQVIEQSLKVLLEDANRRSFNLLYDSHSISDLIKTIAEEDPTFLRRHPFLCYNGTALDGLNALRYGHRIVQDEDDVKRLYQEAQRMFAEMDERYHYWYPDPRIFIKAANQEYSKLEDTSSYVFMLPPDSYLAEKKHESGFLYFDVDTKDPAKYSRRLYALLNIEEDLRTTYEKMYMSEPKSFSYNVAAYHAGQAIEKCLKLILRELDNPLYYDKYRKSHQISAISNEISRFLPDFLSLYPFLPYNSSKLNDLGGLRNGKYIISIENTVEKMYDKALQLYKDTASVFTKDNPKNMRYALDEYSRRQRTDFFKFVNPPDDYQPELDSEYSLKRGTPRIERF